MKLFWRAIYARVPVDFPTNSVHYSWIYNISHEATAIGVINEHNLFGGLEHFLFFHIFGIVIPTD